MDAPLALYRRYRPDTFADVIGQEHVTAPLSAALDNNRVHHAYLFSGPRGCGKTTSARILARTLNCLKGPSSVPCGECESCVELARGGPGSIDVIEIDAASHGGVDDARDLRERAFFAPMKSRFKVYIIDEAHMVTPQGFNALLKLVEEPPAHVRFVFATTEPEKVIGTIKSRTHHYPFRLVPPKVVGDYLLDLCRREGVQVEPPVVPLIVRAGGGSVRDSLSVLDQLIGGSGPSGVVYAQATALLGYTPDALLDETIDALAADDGATLFAVVDKVIDAGQDPRRFAEDLLQRLRDLVIVSAVPDAASRGLLEVSADQAERLTNQAGQFGSAELTRAADVVNVGLTEMRGATAPRLLLELMCARMLLPGVDGSVEGIGARLARLERRLSVTDRPGGAPPATRQGDAPARLPPAAAHGTPATGTDEAGTTPGPALVADADSQVATAAPVSTSKPPASSAGLGLVDVRQLWPGVLDRVKSMRRFAWMVLSQNASVKDVADDVLTLAFVNDGARQSFVRSGNDEIVRQALIEELGVDWQVEAIVDGPGPTTQPRFSSRTGTRHDAASYSSPTESTREARVGPTSGAASGMADPTPAASRATRSEALRHAARTASSSPPSDKVPSEDDEVVSDDDEVLDDGALSSQELLERELGAKLIDEIRHDGA